jgi:hypothetical protein
LLESRLNVAIQRALGQARAHSRELDDGTRADATRRDHDGRIDAQRATTISGHEPHRIVSTFEIKREWRYTSPPHSNLGVGRRTDAVRAVLCGIELELTAFALDLQIEHDRIAASLGRVRRHGLRYPQVRRKSRGLAAPSSGP